MASRVLTVEIVGNAAQLESALGRASAASKGFGARMAEVGRSMTAVGRTLTSAITLPVLAIGAVSIKSAMDFQSSMELIHTQAGVSQKAVDAMSVSVLNMAQSVGTTPETLSTGLFHLASQGLRGARAMEALRIAAEGAKVGQANLEDVTNALGAVLVSGIKGAQSFSDAMGALNAIVGAGDMHMQDLADAMGTGLAAKAAVAKVSLRDVGAALAVLGDNNIRGAQAGTLLASTLRIMAGPSKAAAKELSTVGLGATQLAADLQSPGGIVTAITDLKNHIKDAGVTSAELPTFLNRAFGGRQSGGVQILMDQLERLKTKVHDVQDGMGSFGDAWQSTTETAKFKFDQLLAAFQVAAIKLGNALLPVATKIADFLTKLVDKWDKLSPATKDLVIKIAAIAAAIGPILLVGGKFITFFKDLAPLVSLVATPMGAAAAAVGLFVGALLAAEYAPTQFEAVLEKMGLSAKDAKRVVDDLRTAFDAIRTVVKAVWPVIKATIVSTLKVIEASVKAFDDLLHGRWGKLWHDLENLVKVSLQGILSIVKADLTVLANTAGKLAEAVGEGILHHILDPIKNLGTDAWNWLQKLIGKLQEVGQEAWHEAAKIGSAIVHGLIGGLQSLWGWAKSEVSGWFSGLWSAAKSAVGAHSPATKFIPVGQSIAQGFAVGITNETPMAEDAIRRHVKRVRDAGVKAAQSARQALALSAREIAGVFAQALGGDQAATAAGIRRMLSAAVAATRSGTPAVQAAMRNLANSVMDAFDRATQQGLDRIRSDLEKKLNQITASVNQKIAQVGTATMRYDDKQMAPVNAEDATIKAQQQAMELRDAQNAVQQAQNQLNQDQAAGADANTIAQDKLALQDAQDSLTILQEQIKADADRAAAEKKITEEKRKQAEEDKKIRAEGEHQKQQARDAARSEEEQWRERRKEERKQLAAYIADLRSSLDSLANDWNKYGTKSGKVYAEGLRKAEGEIRKEVAAISRLIRQGLGMDIHVTATPAGGEPHFASGGPTHAGLAVLHEGEYVIQRTAANAIGRANLDALNRLPHFATGGAYGPIPGNPKGDPTQIGKGGPGDTPEMRAAAMWVYDGGQDKWDKVIATALIGAAGPRAQAQAAIRHTYVPGFGELHQGSWRAPMPDSAMMALLTAQYPGIVFETGTPGTQLSAGQALSRIVGGLGAITGIIQSSMGLTGPGSLLERVTSHAIHFDSGYLTDAINAANRTYKQYPSLASLYGPQSSNPNDTGPPGANRPVPVFKLGGVMPWDGLAYLHKNETIIPAGRGNAGVGGDHYHMHIDGIVLGTDQRKVARVFLDAIQSEQVRRGRKVQSLGYGPRGT